MTIKEIEELSGMQRANIRYYEAEGFLHPEREKNGYRNYTEEDLSILMKIKLLRSLHISLEEIKAMQNGEQDLAKTLEEHIVRLTKQQQELEKSKYVCEKMQRDGATYEKLNTEQYLKVLRNCRPDITEREDWVERDTPEPLRAPFLRIFARVFDYLLYMLFWLVLVHICDRLFDLKKDTLVIAACLFIGMGIALALLLEPLFLHWFGATPGKMLLGLYVTYDFGGPIPMEMAWCRAWRAIGLVHEWQYEDHFQIMCIFNDMERGNALWWDYDAHTTIELKDDETWRVIVWGILTVLLLVGILEMFKFVLRV